MSNFAYKQYPEKLTPEELDDYLARGWYRMGQTIFTTHFLCFNERFYSALWIRMDLQQQDRFSKSQRKLMRRNAERFITRVQPANINREKERLFQRYRSHFPGVLAPSLRDSLLDGEDYNIYTTFEITVTDRRTQRLVGLSFFDIGQDSAASISGIYDPDFNQFSIGYYTMLLEIEYCRNNYIRYYYPGYVVPGYDRFAYKLRIGACEFLNIRTEQWEPYDQLTPEDIPLQQMQQKLEQMRLQMSERGVGCRLLYYPLFEAPLFGFWNAPYLDYPLFIYCDSPQEANSHRVIIYNVRTASYELLQCSSFDDLQFYFSDSFQETYDKGNFFLEILIVDRKLGSFPEPAALLEALSESYRWWG